MKRLIRFALFALVLANIIPLWAQSIAAAQPVVIKGTIFDAATNRPIPFASLQVENTGRSAMANDQGEFRLVLERGDSSQVKFSHVAYYSERVTLPLMDSIITRDIFLQPTLIEINGIRVSPDALDPGEQIIVEAIKRKAEILSRLNNYRFEAYTKLVVRDKKKPDTSNIFLITETQVTSYWERPNRYKEIITARKQSKNIKADANLVSVGEILNFNKDRIEIGEDLVPSPTAHDAREHYRYYLLDTVQIDGARVFVLEVEPRTDLRPLFVGQLQIADSTFDVVGVDFGLNEGFHSSILSNLRYAQRFAQFHGKYWMPVEIRFSGEARFSIPIPGIPRELIFEHIASLYSYQLEEGIAAGTFSDVAYEVAVDADRIDSSAWSAGQTIPLTDQELRGYARIDSIERAPKPIGKQILRLAIGLPLLATTQENFFHFNRAEGAYVGAGFGLPKFAPRMSGNLSGGYAIDAEKWQYETSLSYLVWQQYAASVGVTFRDKVINRPTMSFPSNPRMTLPALFDGSDPYDYFSEHGFLANVSARILPHTRFTLGYRNARQNSIGVNSEFTFFDPDTAIRINPAIADGHLRALSADIRYDSRPIYRLKGRDVTARALTYVLVSAGAEYSSPGLLDSDFDYTRYTARFFTRQRLFGLGYSSFQIGGGIAERDIPPQRYFVMAFDPMQMHDNFGLQTLDGRNFAGNRALSMSLRHEFGNRLFRASRLPGISKLPFELSVHGGLFWSEFKDHGAFAGDDAVNQARTAYSEIGFGMGNLAPFLAPFNLTIFATWQLSAYDTDRFTVTWDIGF